ncbi:MAG: hypothetical protein ACTSO9_17055 [Candidatus Helarchaeota archaeon]
MDNLNPKEKKNFEKAMKLYAKAEKFIAKQKFDKAKDNFRKAIKEFYNIKAYKQAQKIINKFVESAIIERDYVEAAVTLYQAANISLIESNVKKALEHYKSSINFFVEHASYHKKEEELKYRALCFYPLCEASIGKFEESIDHFKTNLKDVPKHIKFKLPIFDFCTAVFNSIISKKIEVLKGAESLLNEIKFLDGEKKLISALLKIIDIYIKTKVETKINKQKLEAGDKISLKISLNSPEPVEIVKYFLEYDKQRLNLTNIPKIVPNKPLEFIFELKVAGKAKFGPLNLICKTQSGIEFPFKYQSSLNILSGRPKLDIDVESEIKIIEGDVFDLEFDITNKGRGEAQNVKVELMLPEEILIIAGTNEKKLYSLNSQENYTFTFPLQTIKSGNYSGKIKISFEIPQGISREPEKILEEKKITFEVN